MTHELAPEQAEAFSEVLESKPKTKMDLKDMFIMSLCPLMLGKLMIFYFGSNYSSNPGEGYGIGLAGAIVFTLVMAGRFIWKYRDYQDE